MGIREILNKIIAIMVTDFVPMNKSVYSAGDVLRTTYQSSYEFAFAIVQDRWHLKDINFMRQIHFDFRIKSPESDKL